MTKEIIAGISISENFASLAILEHRPDEIELLFLHEHRRMEDTEYWYVDPLEQYVRSSRTKVHRVAVALDAASLVVLTCPLDTSFTQSELNEHIQWELSHFVRNYQPKEHINDVHILKTRAGEHIEYGLAVAVRRSLVFGLQEYLNERELALGVVDVNHFAADTTILRSHPEAEKGRCACVGFGETRVDVSTLWHGRMAGYRYGIFDTVHGSRQFLGGVLADPDLNTVYIFGTGLSKDHEKIVRSLVKCPVVPLNPFRRILISHNFPYFPQFIATTHRFASAVGIALRRS